MDIWRIYWKNMPVNIDEIWQEPLTNDGFFARVDTEFDSGCDEEE